MKRFTLGQISRRQTNLHSGQHQDHINYHRSKPLETIEKEGAVMSPLDEVVSPNARLY